MPGPQRTTRDAGTTSAGTDTDADSGHAAHLASPNLMPQWAGGGPTRLVAAMFLAGMPKSTVFDLLRARDPADPIDPGVVQWIHTRFAQGTDDLWLAEQLIAFGAEPRWPFTAIQERQRRAQANGWAPEPGGISADFDAGKGRTPVTAFYFPGTSDRRAMIIGGVHGSERAGVEVAQLLLARLRAPGAKPPLFSVIVVPVLFPENVAAGARSTAGQPDPNRQMPKVGDTPAGTDSLGRPMEASNRILLDLVERFRPERIASCHGHSPPAPPATDMPSITDDPRPGHEKEDDALALDMARAASSMPGGARVPGNHLGTPQETSRYPTSTAAHQPGVSFGEYGSHAAGARPAMNVITIETFGNVTSAGAADHAARKVELESIASVLDSIFLNRP